MSESIPYPETQAQLDELYAEYYLTFGRFMHVFGSTESSLSSQLQISVLSLVYPGYPLRQEEELNTQEERQAQARARLLGIAAVKAVTAGSRLAQMKDTFKRLLRIKKSAADDAAEIDMVFAHLGEIQFVRNCLVHNAAYMDMKENIGWFKSSNVKNVKEHEKQETISFSLAMLTAMTNDLFWVSQRVSHAMQPEFYEHIGKMNESATWIDERRIIRARPWHYDPTELKRTGRKYIKDE